MFGKVTRTRMFIYTFQFSLSIFILGRVFMKRRLSYFLTFTAAAAVPNYVLPDLIARIQAQKQEILEMTGEALGLAPLGENEDVLEPLSDRRESFKGVMDLSVPDFADAWKELSIEQTVDDSQHNACLSLLWMMYIERPAWYVASLDELDSLRSCIDMGLKLIEPREISDERVRFVAHALSELAKVAYSPKAELALRLEQSATDGLEYMEERVITFVFFNKYMHNRPRILALLDNVASVYNDLGEDVEPVDLRMAESFVYESHAADFVDHHWARLVRAGQGRNSLHLWRKLVEVESSSIFSLETGKLAMIDNPARFLTSQLRSDIWDQSVGYLMSALAEINDPSICGGAWATPEGRSQLLTETIPQHPLEVIEVYKCIIDKIEEGVIAFSELESADHLATLMHMARVSTGPAAFVALAAR